MEPVSPEHYFSNPTGRTLLDVRSPAEFTEGHLPGALSLPLFTDDERAEVGTLYKQTSPDAALLRGLEIAGGKLRGLVERARSLAPEGRVAVYCWRGGQRSGSVGWLLEQAGFGVQRITGGYKASRHYLRRWLAEAHHDLRVLSGPTGTGKTDILHALRDRGASIVDLEGLANHKGSSFGALGEEPQPSSESFENQLFAALHGIPEGHTVYLEDESRLIGRVCQPDAFYDRLVSAPAIAIEQPTEWRVDRLVAGYAAYPPAGLRDAFTRLRKKLGGQHLQTALDALDREDFAAACRIALVYYDKAYAHYAAQKAGQTVPLTASAPGAEVIAEQILALP